MSENTKPEAITVDGVNAINKFTELKELAKQMEVPVPVGTSIETLKNALIEKLTVETAPEAGTPSEPPAAGTPPATDPDIVEKPAVKSTPKYVSVFCKLPNGLTFTLADGKSVTLAGGNSARAVAGYGVTKNMDAELWAEIKRVYKDHPALNPIKQIIYDCADTSYGMDKAEDSAGVKTGMERIDPDKPGVAGVTKDDKQQK